MVAITYNAPSVSPRKKADHTRVAKAHQNILGRLFTAVMEARLQQAYREIGRRAYLFDKRGLRKAH
jgi:hypothetical protein